MATQIKQGGAYALPIDLTAAFCRAVRRQLGSDFTGIRSKAFQTATFSGQRIELDVTSDIPDDLDTREFRMPGAILADIAATGPHTLSALVVEMG